MSYHHFARLYDTLMEDVPYESWVRYINEKMREFGNGGKRILDLGCGTGTLSLPLAHQGYDVVGVDLSEEMLTIAQEKAMEASVNIELYQMDMRELDGLTPFDCIGIFCDSLNYLKSEKDVQQTFENVYKQLVPTGLLLFDVHSIFKMTELFIGQSYTRNAEDIAYIWNCYQGEEANSVEHDLSFFVQQSTGLYERFDEIHYQRTFSIEKYEQLLSQAGFKIVDIAADFKNEKPTNTSERIFIAAVKAM